MTKIKRILLICMVILPVDNVYAWQTSPSQPVAQSAVKTINVTSCTDLDKALGSLSSNTIINFSVSCSVDAINIQNLNNVTIQGISIKGVKPTLSFKSPFKLGFEIDNSSFVTIKNIAIDYDEPLYTKGKVLSVNNGKYIIQLEKNPQGKSIGKALSHWLSNSRCPISGNNYADVLACSYNIDDLVYVDIFDANGNYKSGNKETFRVLDRSQYADSIVFTQKENVALMELDFNKQPKLQALTLQVGDIVGVQPSRGKSLFKVYHESGAVTLDSLDIYASPNVVVHENATKAFPRGNRDAFALKMTNLHVAPRGCVTDRLQISGNCSAAGLYSANKGGLNSQGAERGPIITNSAFVRTGDDPVNVHGWFYSLKMLDAGTCQGNVCSMNFSFEIMGKETKRAASHSFAANDTVKIFSNAVSSSETDQIFAGVVSKVNANHVTLTMNRPDYLKIQKAKDLYLTVDKYNGTNAFIANNLFAYTKRGVLIRSNNAKVINNQFLNVAAVGIWFGTELNGKFDEGSFPQMPEIRGNQFNNVAYNTNSCTSRGKIKKNCDWAPVTFKVRKGYETPSNNHLLRIDKSMISGNRKENRDYNLSEMCVRNTVDSNGSPVVGNGCVD